MKKIILFLIITFSISCTTTEDNEFGDGNELIISTMAISAITNTEALTGGTIIDDGGKPIFSVGVCWSTSVMPTVDDDEFLEDFGNGASFTLQLTDLTPDTQYFVRAFMGTGEEIVYGEELSFTTTNDAPTPPCSVQANRLEMSNLSNSFSFNSALMMTDAFGDYWVQASGNGGDVRIYFNEDEPVSRIYKTKSWTDLPPSTVSECRIDATLFNQTYRLGADHDVYIEKTGTNQYNITICDFTLPSPGNPFPTIEADCNITTN